MHIAQYANCHKYLPHWIVTEMASQVFVIVDLGCCIILKFAIKKL